MNNINEKSMSEILIMLIIKILSSKYTIVNFDIIMEVLISIYLSRPDYKGGMDRQLLIYIFIQIAGNILCIFFGHLDQKGKKYINYISEAYNIHSNINFSMAGRLYDDNNNITKSIRDRIIKKDIFNDLLDFQKLSQDICNVLYNFVDTNFKCKECEISIFQRFADEHGAFVKMIAYKNNNKETSSWGKKFDLDKIRGRIPFFIKIFKDLNAEIKVLPDKESIEENFSFLEGSKIRENEICQYIGVPIKTKRNKVEILLQIDVSKEKILGKSENDLTEFAKNIIKPFCDLLYSSYERDLILNKFYDILEDNIKCEEE